MPRIVFPIAFPSVTVFKNVLAVPVESILFELASIFIAIAVRIFTVPIELVIEQCTLVNTIR